MPRTATSPQSTPATTSNELLDMDQAITALATTRPTFYRWLRAGTVKGIKVGRQWRFRREDIDRFLSGEGPRADLPADLNPLIEALSARLGEPAAEAGGDRLALAARLAVRLGLHVHASDLHLLVLGAAGLLQLRIDGALSEVARFDVRLLPLLVEQFKRMLGMDAAISGQTQDGRMVFEQDGRRAEIRATVLPSGRGDGLVARFHDQAMTPPSIEALRLGERERSVLERAIRGPSGLVLFSGATGSGKGTVMYACANSLASPTARLVLVERYGFCSLPDAVQVRIDEERGMSYPAALRSVMRADPDVIAIDQVRDRETMEATIECAVSGHLVLATLHALDALSALRRIADLSSGHEVGVDELRVVVAQRLVRRLCPSCAVTGRPSAALARRAELLAGAGGIPWSSLTPAWRHAAGCTACRDTGYAGRVMVCEVLEVSRELRLALHRGAADDELRLIAIGQGFTTMAADGVRKAAEGLTTLDELQSSQVID